MTRVLVCIPHYFRRTGADSQMEHGSNTDSAAVRAAQISHCLRSVVGILEPTQFQMGSPGDVGMAQVVMAPKDLTGDVVMVATPENNLLDQVSNQTLVEHVIWDGPPRELGYQCRRVFAERIDDYDLFCFVEDDIAILDPYFFHKIRAFHAAHGEDYILLPHRFEVLGQRDAAWRSYIDVPAFPGFVTPDVGGPEELWLPSFEGRTRLTKSRDPLSACYVVTRDQLRRWTGMANFHAPHPEIVSRRFDPLEMTQVALEARLPFYRPAQENLAFLEVHHVPNRLSKVAVAHQQVKAIVMPQIEARRARRAART